MKILVKGNNWLGDAVLSLPTLRSLKAMFPEGRLAVLTKPSLADLYRGAPYVDEVLPERRGGIGSWWATVRELRRRRFDAALVLPRSFRAAFVVWGAGIPRRIGYGAGRGALLTDRVRPLEGRVHRVHRYHHLLSAFGSPPPVEPPRLELLPEAVCWAQEEFPGGPWVGLHPGATYGAAKQWLPERFAELGRRLGARASVAVIGGPGEEALGSRVAREAGAARCLAGRTTIPQLAAALARCRLLVTNDTGPMHVADALGVPVVAIFGPTDWIETPPFGPRHRIVRRPVPCSPCLARTCPLGHHECMRSVTVDEVERACREFLP
ncbi:MAG: lipopolysaccharide heptosyltransferase II [Planctomycetota bacterium]